MKIVQKLYWIVGFILVIVLIYTTNRIDRKNFQKIHASTVSIYKDRLIAQDLISKILIEIQKKEKAICTRDSSFLVNENIKVNKRLEELIEQYELTMLTTKEKATFEMLKSGIDQIAFVSLENSKFNSPLKDREFILLKEHLIQLSEVQVVEGERLFKSSADAIDSVKLHFQIEMYFILVIGLLIQVIIILKPKK
jgi:hypothetical protein